MQWRAILIMCGGNGSELYIFSRFFPFPPWKSKEKIWAHANQNQETSFTAAPETTLERAADPPAQTPRASLYLRRDTGLWSEGRARQFLPDHQRAEGQDIHRMPWKLTFVKLHLPLLSGLKPEALVLPAMCAMAPGWATGLTFLDLEIRR